MKTCFFIGHRNAPESLTPLLDEAIERHITEYGVAEFVVGHYGNFDMMVAGAVRRAKPHAACCSGACKTRECSPILFV